MKTQIIGNLHKLSVLAALAMLTACGGGSGTSPQSVTGLVADGYLQGAIVFLDKDGTKKWDGVAPKAVTDDNGKYTLDNVSAADLAKYPIVVEVPAGAVDKDRGPVTKPYILQAPPGKPDFVSPLTTLVQQEVEKSGVTPDQAEAAVKQNLGLSATTSLFKDFKANAGAAATDEYKHAANVAMVVATAIADNKAAVDAKVATLGLTGDQTAAVTKLVLDTISQQVTTIVQQVLANVNTSTGVLDQSKIANIITNSNVAVSTTDTTELKQQLTIQNATTIPVSFKDAISGTGLFNIDSWYNGQYRYYEYQKILLGQQGTDGAYSMTEALFYYASPSWVPRTDSSQDYFLTATGWQQASDNAAQGVVTVNADGSIIWKHKTLNYGMTVVATVKDVSGMAIQPLVTPSGISVSSTAVFPDGSNAYKMTFTPLQTSYRVWGGASYVFIPDGQGGSKPATTLADFIAGCQDGQQNSGWFGLDSNSKLVGKFVGTGTATGSTGTLKFYYPSFGQTGTSLTAYPDTGTWKIEEPVTGYQVLVLTLPVTMKQYMDSDQKTPIFGVADGKVRQGSVEYQGVARLDRGFNFNNTAFMAIKDAFQYVAKMVAKK